MSTNLNEFVKERNEALLSLDKDRILAYMKKYQVNLPADSDKVFWASVHKAILAISAPEDKKEQSRKWLREHGFKESF